VVRSQARARELLGLAQRLASEGTPRADAVEQVAAATRDRRDLQAAHLQLVRRMHRLPSDDFAATEALRIVLGALGMVPFDRR